MNPGRIYLTGSFFVISACLCYGVWSSFVSFIKYQLILFFQWLKGLEFPLQQIDWAIIIGLLVLFLTSVLILFFIRYNHKNSIKNEAFRSILQEKKK